MKKWILKFYENDVIRYIFWGGCTTLVNLLSFYIMRAMGIPLMSANIISIILAILFAYVVNSRFVFHDRCETWRDHIRPFLKFISARLVTMVIEVGGVWFLAEILGFRDMFAKEMGQYCKAPAFSGRAGEYADTDRRYHRYTGGTCGEKSSGCHVRG